ncbi:amino acid ABC transporter permease [Bradyrhizobium zhanjiangense]|uniref:Amino acid ABC transporter permease n=1 Tax=Bradyrhizobium zhanjiangense TaxID=1325107 RepID=A0ABY0D9E4_9BRAD|nr:amino acid ABC transporter permease [Bradyrhizobium zhanjiangense]RXG86640.1 amino acid ABC transporter permease [Bradyrhizobium zhanjiangense]
MQAVLVYWPSLAQGLWVTVWLAFCTILGAALGALVLGPLRLSKSIAIRATSIFFIEFIRAPSALVLLFWVFYVLPLLPLMPQLSPLTASILVLSLDGAVYAAEIVRAGIEAVHRGQTDACHALGLSKLQSLTKVILPQALSQIVPAFGSLARDMVKWTSIVSFVGVQDVLYVANNVRSQTFEAAPVLCLLGALYWILSLLCAAAFRVLEHALPLNRALRAARLSLQVAPDAGAPAGVTQ